MGVGKKSCQFLRLALDKDKLWKNGQTHVMSLLIPFLSVQVDNPRNPMLYVSL